MLWKCADTSQFRACVATVIRAPFIETLGRYKGNFLYDTRWVAIMSTYEVGIGITAASAATFRPIIQKCTGSVGSRHYQSKPRLNDYPFSNRPSRRRGSQNLFGSKGTSTTIITGRESFTNIPDLVMLESLGPADFSDTAHLSRNRGDPA